MHYSNVKLGSDVNIDLDVSLRVHYGDRYRCNWQEAHTSGHGFQRDAAHSRFKCWNIEMLHFLLTTKKDLGCWLILNDFFLNCTKKRRYSELGALRCNQLQKKKKKIKSKSLFCFPFFVVWNTFAVAWDLFGCLEELTVLRCLSRFQ